MIEKEFESLIELYQSVLRGTVVGSFQLLTSSVSFLDHLYIGLQEALITEQQAMLMMEFLRRNHNSYEAYIKINPRPKSEQIPKTQEQIAEFQRLKTKLKSLVQDIQRCISVSVEGSSRKDLQANKTLRRQKRIHKKNWLRS